MSQVALGVSLLPSEACHCPNKKQEQATDHEASLRNLAEALEKQIPVWLEEATVPGLSMAIIQDAKIAWHRGFGFKDQATKERVDENTIFQAGSTSKPVFAYMALKLCEKGVIGLDTPLTKYAPERFVNDPRLDLITARHILSHTSGFPNWRSEKEPLKIHFIPGEKWLYSGEGYYYLQSVLTHLLGRVDRNDCAQFESGLEVCATDFDSFMKANLLEPFGMHSSGYLWNEKLARQLARPHGTHGEPLEIKKPTRPAVARYGSSGALLTTPTDYAKFVIEVIAPKASDRFRLTKASVKEMLRPQIKLEGPHERFWALGWEVFTEKKTLIYHGGDNEGFHCGALASVDGQRGYVVMTNGENGPEVLKRILEGARMQSFLGL